MGRLIYAALASLDGYVADETGRFDWAVPDEEVHTFINELQRPVRTHLYGRRMYETMVAWESPEALGDHPPYIHEFAAIWQDADKVVYSRTLETAASARTRIERDFDLDAVRQLKASTDHDLSVSGPELAAHAIRGGLVDEYHLFVAPSVVGGGTRWLPDGVRLSLELLEERRFDNGMVYVRYRQGEPPE